MQRSFATSLTLLLLTAATASAQTTFSLGLRGGVNRTPTLVDPNSSLSGSYPYNYSITRQAIMAWQAGAVLEVRFDKLALQPALVFSQKGEQLHYTSSISGVVGTSTYSFDGTNRYNWLELPLTVVYTLHGDHGLQFLAGPYAALAVGGWQKGTESGTSSTGILGQFSDSLDGHITYGASTGNRRFDAGLNVGLGYCQGPVQVQLSYGLGLLNLHTKGMNYPAGATYFNYRPYDVYNRVAQLTGTYFFKL